MSLLKKRSFMFFAYLFLGICFSTTSFAAVIPIKTFQGKEIAPHAKELSSFFMKMYQDDSCYFSESEWDGYIQSYVANEESIAAIAIRNEKIVGAALGTPLLQASEKYRKPFFSNPASLHSLYYLGDLAVPPEYAAHRLKQRLFYELRDKVKEIGHFEGITLWQSLSRDQTFSNSFLNYIGFQHHPEYYFEEFYKNEPSSQETAHSMTSWIFPLR